jgi:isopentenyl diphosphate isomerase/L-lactate dehydrogenase-like FMN-dependent dehydrogenase
LAVAGQEGVAHVLKTLDAELDRVMGLAGVEAVTRIAPAELVVRAQG